ncbi:MAG: DUF975 family protein [Kiritimatiellae bacterium]|nr:DUF975 family protein [Kiritimatiellia bacterium]
MDWFYVAEGQQVGPVSEENIKGLVANGTIAKEALVWHDGMPDWVAYDAISAETETPAGPETGSTLSLKKKEEPAPTSTTETKESKNICEICHRIFPAEQMIEYEGANICDECKPAFFQRIQKGSAGTGGNTPNAELMERARASLSGTWGLAIGFIVLYQLISIACQFIPIIGNFIPVLISGPMATGSAIFFIALVRGNEPEIGMLFHGFRRFGTTFVAYLLISLFILGWMLLLIIPGIIATYAYSMTFYILADDEEIGAREAIQRSKEMMQGNKWKIFCLSFRFIGWSLLCVLTLGIGFLWLVPYISASLTEFYEDVKAG